MRFEQVHESFYKNLLAKHPDLTTREKRLAALLKLNLTSKEIAQITGQTSKSVENARTRLRKKLEITNSQTDLSAYLTNFG
jgi:DNA-binding CsgD family transcriptional regulator